MMRRISVWVLGLMIVLIAGCGGGGGNAGTCALCGGSGSTTGTTSGGTTTTTATVSDLRITLSSATIPNKSPQPITVTVTAVNASNQIVSAASVVVTADTGVVTSSAASTDTSGNLGATLGMGGVTTPRTITLTATSGSITKTATVQVVDSAATGVPSMTVSLSSQTVTANSPATVTVFVKDSNGVAVPNSVVSFASVNGLGAFSSLSALTNAQGMASVALYPIKSSSSGADYVQATATVNGAGALLTQTAGFQITATSVTIATFTSDLGAGNLSAYGQANLTVTLGGTTAGTPVALSVVSLCANKNKATITPSTVTTSNGTASFTYKDAQCGATDKTDNVTVSITGTATSQALSIPLSSPTASSLGFDSAAPATIFLKGSGFTETSTVTFVVKDQAGNPLPNQSVDMSPTTTVGGLTMDGGTGTVTKLSDSSGQVAVRINSGTIPTPVRIKATLTGTAITTVSSNLSVAVGLPSQLNFSLSQGTINIEGMNVDGTPNTYTIIASDRMGNPVPAGTAINFVTEGGQVAPQAVTTVTNGLAGATVTFQSASPRPADGRVTVLAYALGEESFLDANGDNVWQPGEFYQDLGNVFLSRKYSATFNNFDATQSDQYIAQGSLGGTTACTTTSTTSSSPLLALDASIPSMQGGTCDGTWGKAYVRRAVETVFSTSSSRLLWRRGGPDAGILDNECRVVNQQGILGTGSGNIVISDDGWNGALPPQAPNPPITDVYRQMGYGTLYNMPAQGSFSFLVSDANPYRLNPMPAGTTISVTSTPGMSVSVGSGSPVASTSSVTGASVGFQFTTASSGTIFITTTSPKGLSSGVSINVNMAPLPNGTACTL